MKVPIKIENNKITDAEGIDVLENEVERTTLQNCVNGYPILNARVNQLFEKLASLVNMLIGGKFMNDEIRSCYKLIASYIKEDTGDLHLFHFRFELPSKNEKGEDVKAPGSFFLPAKDVSDLAVSIHTTIAEKIKGKIAGEITSDTITDVRDEEFNNVTVELVKALKELENTKEEIKKEA